MVFIKEVEPLLKIPTTKCPVCIQAKHAKKPFRSIEKIREEPLELVHTDLIGPVEMSVGKHRYLLTIIDDHSRKIFMYPLESKAEVLKIFKNFTELAEKQTGKRLKALRSDNGKEYVNRSFETFCQERGIIHEKTTPYNPQQNGVAERYNRTIMEKVRAMILDAKLGKVFWAEAANTAVYLLNAIPKKQNKRSANEKWNGEKINLRELRVFGEEGFVYVPSEKRSSTKDLRVADLWDMRDKDTECGMERSDASL